jgi:hypothetical protein
MPRRLGLARQSSRRRASGRDGEPTRLRDDPVQHLQHALNFIALDDPGHAMSALAAQLETEGVLLARNRQPIGELGGNCAGFENVRRRLRHRRSGLGDGRFALERNRFAAQIRRRALRQIRSIGQVSAAVRDD